MQRHPIGISILSGILLYAHPRVMLPHRVTSSSQSSSGSSAQDKLIEFTLNLCKDFRVYIVILFGSIVIAEKPRATPPVRFEADLSLS